MFYELTKPEDYFTHKISMENTHNLIWTHNAANDHTCFWTQLLLCDFIRTNQFFLWSVWHSSYPSHSHMHTYASTTVYVVYTYNPSTSTIYQH